MATVEPYINFDLQKPPLPFVGNKLRWWRVLQPMIEALPRGTRCFDAFAGCFAVSKLLQRFSDGLYIMANDYARYYRSRLKAVEDTNRVLAEMLAAGAHNGLRCHYEKYPPDVEQRLIQICATGKDQISCRANLYCGPKTIRARCRLVPYSEDACRRWLDGLDVCDVRLDALDALQYADTCDLMILDPPYRTPPKSWGQGEYIGRAECNDARDFCAAVIARGRCAVWLFDEPGSELVRMATDEGGIVHPYPFRHDRQRATEVLAVLRPIRSKIEDLPLFAWARKKGIDILGD